MVLRRILVGIYLPYFKSSKHPQRHPSGTFTFIHFVLYYSWYRYLQHTQSLGRSDIADSDAFTPSMYLPRIYERRISYIKYDYTRYYDGKQPRF